MVEGEVVVQGKTVHFAKAGRGPTIVLAHGWTNNWIGWVPLINHAVGDFTLYALDLLGYGQSDRLDEYSVAIQADFLAGFIRQLQLKPIAVCGLSMATFIVADLARRYSKLTESIVLIGPVFPVGKKRSLIGRLIHKGLLAVNKHNLSEAALKKLIERRITGYLSAKYLTMHKFNKFLIDAYSLIGRKQMSKEVFVQMGISVSEYPLAQVLDELTVPTLLIFGSDDKFTRLEQAQRVLKRKDIEFVKIQQAGHVANLEQPALVVSAMKKFLQKLDFLDSEK